MIMEITATKTSVVGPATVEQLRRIVRELRPRKIRVSLAELVRLREECDASEWKTFEGVPVEVMK